MEGVKSSGLIDFPSYGPIHVPTGIFFLAEMPQPAPGMLDVHKPTSGGSDLSASGSVLLVGDVLCLCWGQQKSKSSEHALASHPKCKKRHVKNKLVRSSIKTLDGNCRRLHLRVTADIANLHFTI